MRCGERLTVLEAGIAVHARRFSGDAVGEPGGQAAAMPATSGATIAGKQNLGDDHPAVDRGDAGTHDDCADQATEEGVRGAGGQAEQPGEQVPDDRADQPGQDDRSGDECIVEETAGDGLGDLGGEAGSDEIEHRGQDDGGTRLERTGRDRTGHRVGAVVEPVGEVEDEGYGDNRDDDEQHCHVGPHPERVAWYR